MECTYPPIHSSFIDNITTICRQKWSFLMGDLKRQTSSCAVHHSFFAHPIFERYLLGSIFSYLSVSSKEQESSAWSTNPFFPDNDVNELFFCFFPLLRWGLLLFGWCLVLAALVCGVQISGCWGNLVLYSWVKYSCLWNIRKVQSISWIHI